MIDILRYFRKWRKFREDIRIESSHFCLCGINYTEELFAQANISANSRPYSKILQHMNMETIVIFFIFEKIESSQYSKKCIIRNIWIIAHNRNNCTIRNIWVIANTQNHCRIAQFSKQMDCNQYSQPLTYCENCELAFRQLLS